MPDTSSALSGTSTLDPLALDPNRPGVAAQLRMRTEHGGYIIPDGLLVQAIRAFYAKGQIAHCHALFGILRERCMPMFRRMAGGLRHRPEWVEDAIADMTMQLWKEVIDPTETFMVQNFGVYLKRLGADQFKHTLRQEGRIYRTNDRGEVTGRPEHIPAALIDSLDRAPGVDEDATDAIDERMSEIEADRILHFVCDPLNRKIVTLRVFYHLKWDEIAHQCGMSERTMRMRYEVARAQMAAGLGGLPAPPDEAEPHDSPPRAKAKPARGRKARKDELP